MVTAFISIVSIMGASGAAISSHVMFRWLSRRMAAVYASADMLDLELLFLVGMAADHLPELALQAILCSLGNSIAFVAQILINRLQQRNLSLASAGLNDDQVRV